jgi:hypothetical protein
MEHRNAIETEVQRFLDERSQCGLLKLDLVNLDREGKRGLVYLDGAIVIDENEQVLDGLHRLAAIRESGVSVDCRVVRVPPDTRVDGAIYVLAGPTPDFVVNRKLQTILIGSGRDDREATIEEIRTATARAMTEYFGN